MTLRVKVTIYWGRGMVITGHGGTINPIEESRKRVTPGTGWQSVTPKGALKNLLDRINIKNLLVPTGTWLCLQTSINENDVFKNRVDSLPQIRILSRKDVKDLLQEALKGTGFDAQLFVAFGEAYFYPSDLRK